MKNVAERVGGTFGLCTTGVVILCKYRLIVQTGNTFEERFRVNGIKCADTSKYPPPFRCCRYLRTYLLYTTYTTHNFWPFMFVHTNQRKSKRRCFCVVASLLDMGNGVSLCTSYIYLIKWLNVG